MIVRASAWLLIVAGTAEFAAGVTALPSPADQIVGGVVALVLGAVGLVTVSVNDI